MRLDGSQDALPALVLRQSLFGGLDAALHLVRRHDVRCIVCWSFTPATCEDENTRPQDHQGREATWIRRTGAHRAGRGKWSRISKDSRASLQYVPPKNNRLLILTLRLVAARPPAGRPQIEAGEEVVE